MGDFQPPDTAVNAVRDQLRSFYAMVDLPDKEFNEKPYKYRFQSIPDFFGIPVEHYTPRANTARSLMALRKAFKPQWVARAAISVPLNILQGYVACMCCHKEGVTQGLLSTVAKPIEDHPKSDVHLRMTRASGGGQLALTGPVLLEDMNAVQLMAFLATGSSELTPAASGAS